MIENLTFANPEEFLLLEITTFTLDDNVLLLHASTMFSIFDPLPEISIAKLNPIYQNS